MKLLVFTQKVDKEDPVLGFFHNWIIELSKRCEVVEVICLMKGSFDLPKNVTVYSLGKERGVSKLQYVINLYKYLYLIRKTYDRVFVHMNQEYVLLAGLYWKFSKIPVYMWRNHPAGSPLTRLAVFLSTKVFCTSEHAFVARFKKTVIMPAGIDTSIFRVVEGVVRKKYSVCMFGRISPVKHIDLALKAVKVLASRGAQISLDIVGPSLERDMDYSDGLKKYVEENNLGAIVHFSPGVSFDNAPQVFNEYEVCLNLTDSGSFDKTIVEAAACGAIPLVSNVSLSHLLPPACTTENSPEAIADSISRLIDPRERVVIQKDLESFVNSQSLNALMEKLLIEIK